MMKKLAKAMTILTAAFLAVAVLAVPVKADEKNDAYLESIRASAIAAAQARDKEAAKGLAAGLEYLMSIDIATLRDTVSRDAQALSGLEKGYAYLSATNETLAERAEADVLKAENYLGQIDTATGSAIVYKDLKAASDSISGIRYLISLDAALDPSIAEEDLQILAGLSDMVDEVQAMTSSMLAR